MTKRFLVVALLAAFVALPAAIPAAASGSKTASPPVSTTNLAYGTKLAHDWTRPRPTIKRAAGQPNPTSQSVVRFTVSFSEAVHGFTAAGVRLSGIAKGAKVKLSGLRNHRSFRVTVIGVKRPGVIVASVKAGAARDAAGNPSTAGNSVKVTAVVTTSRPKKKPAPSVPAPETPSSPPTSSPPASSPSTSSPPASSSLIVGTIVNAAGGGTAALDKAAAAGAHWIREDLWWPTVEATRGQLDWSSYDNLFLAAAQRGIHILPIIDGTPDWAGNSAWSMPSDPTPYATFAGLVAAHYGPGGTFWQAHSDLSQYAPVYFEIWNEPWWPQFSKPVDAGRYARLAQAAGQAIHAANSQAKAIAATEWQYTAADGSTRDWTDDMLSAVPNLGAAIDAFSVHPYAANTSVDTWTGSNWQTAKLDREIRPDLIRHGLGDKPIWVTEIGWPTCSSACNGFTESEQAANLARFDQLVRTEWTYVKAVFYYALNDQDGGSGDPTDREQWFGVIRRDGSHKPAYAALVAAFAD